MNFTALKTALSFVQLSFIKINSWTENAVTNNVTELSNLNSESDFLSKINSLGIAVNFDISSNQNYTLVNNIISFGTLSLNIETATAAAAIEGKTSQEYIDFKDSKTTEQIYAPRLYSSTAKNKFEIIGLRGKSYLIPVQVDKYLILDNVVYLLTSDYDVLKAAIQTITSRAFFFDKKINANVNITGLIENQVLLGDTDGTITQTDKIVIKNERLGIGNTNPAYSFDLLDLVEDANIRIKSNVKNSWLRLSAAAGFSAGVNFQIDNVNTFTNFSDSAKWGVYSQLLDSNVLEVTKTGLLKILQLGNGSQMQNGSFLLSVDSSGRIGEESRITISSLGDIEINSLKVNSLELLSGLKMHGQQFSYFEKSIEVKRTTDGLSPSNLFITNINQATNYAMIKIKFDGYDYFKSQSICFEIVLYNYLNSPDLIQYELNNNSKYARSTKIGFINGFLAVAIGDHDDTSKYFFHLNMSVYIYHSNVTNFSVSHQYSTDSTLLGMTNIKTLDTSNFKNIKTFSDTAAAVSAGHSGFYYNTALAKIMK